jgi:hypothetical protein
MSMHQHCAMPDKSKIEIHIQTNLFDNHLELPASRLGFPVCHSFVTQLCNDSRHATWHSYCVFYITKCN